MSGNFVFYDHDDHLVLNDIPLGKFEKIFRFKPCYLFFA